MSLEKLFYPRSIAVIGASPNMGGDKMPFYQIMKFSGYQGDIYPVNPGHKDIGGVKVYPSVCDIPGEVDLAIVVLPVKRAIDALEDAVKKDVKFVHFFTSGFSEVGDMELEKTFLKAIENSNTRIVGPNCIGVHCAESRISFDPTLKQEDPGNVGFMGQSGGVTHNFTRLARSRAIGLNKAVSYGNQINIRVEDYMDYFGRDDSIKAIAAYIEDIKDGRKFLDVLKRVAPKKPVVILKGGVTEKGAMAAASHTGAMAMPNEIWSAAMRQFRCIEVGTIEQMVDVTTIAASDKIPRGPRVCFVGAGGGTSVLFADLAVLDGLEMPELQKRTQDKIMEKISDVNTSTTNPVDLGAWGIDPKIMTYALKAIDEDENIDAIIPYFSLDFINTRKGDKAEKDFRDIVEATRSLRKPMIPVLSKFSEGVTHVNEAETRILSIFRDAGLPAYTRIQHATYALGRITKWNK